ncbi:MAG TPA: hypothetical protein VES20_24690 [Bryobacteraceae bacterium]|nr:hypothetical protein [Bryobacteraceae bacterium]
MIAGLLLLAGGAFAKKYPLTADSSVPAARGQVDVGRDKNGNTKVELQVEHLAAPENLTPPKAAYIVWFQERGGEALNQGLLKPGKNLKGTFKSVTQMKTFEVIVTAESDTSAKTPSGVEVMRGTVQP